MVASGSGAPSSDVSSKWGMGRRESKATVSTHLKYSASKDLHYICNIINERLYMWTGLQRSKNREKA
jgi:hypothetical protein